MKLDELDFSFLSEGITHIEELPIDSFLNAVKNINMFEISEKVDGANLIFGLDEKGKFYTSRESKGGQRYYYYQDWGDKFWQTGFKSAHAALEKIAQQILKPGDAVEVEILFGELPNTVPYSGEENQIIFLREVSGDPDIQKMADQLEGKSITSIIDKVPYTEDGKTIQFRPEEHKWTFAKVPAVPTEALSKEEAKAALQDNIENLESYLKQSVQIGNTTMSVAEVLAIKLNKRPETIDAITWRTAKDEIKSKKAKVIEKIQQMQLGIKEVLLDELVRNVRSEFGPALDAGGWIEGVVLRHKDTGEQLKIVDKSIFTALNKFYHEIISQITDNRNADSIKRILTGGMAETLGHPQLGTSAAKRYVDKFGNSKDEILANLGKAVDVNSAKSTWLKLLIQAEANLNQLLTDYITSNRSKDIVFGKQGKKTFKHEGPASKKTLETFADFKKFLETTKDATQSAKTGADLVNILVGDKISSISESEIMEGGKATGAGAITREEIGPTLMELSQIIDVPAIMLKSNMLGSAGKVDISGDIDIALDAKTYNPEEIFPKLKAAVGEDNIKVLKGLGIISSSFPIKHYDDSVQTDKLRTGRVQIDLMFGKTDWLKFGFYSAGDKSKYKGLYRTLLLIGAAASLGQGFTRDGELVGKLGPTMLLNLGIQIQSKLRPVKARKKGPPVRLKGFNKVSLKDFKAAFPEADIDRYGKMLVDNPQEVATMLFGDVKPDVKPSDLSTFEQIFELVQKKNPEQQKAIISKVIERLNHAKLPIPPEIESLNA